MNRPVPIDEEFVFDDGVIISETDLKGIITYANRRFCRISGYDRSELDGENHNIVRHPDMPKSVFKDLWDTIQSGKSWVGTVKNLRKDGLYYWVYTFISPVVKNNEIVGYVAARKPASPTEIEEAEASYKKSLEEEK
ncbi:Methyl-accepting chemotaxis protein [hydrothermal vent metagenome]|uniref:Methyl-accepting chemotaxis protein n=1 Tax=hydrothermal vent metagenome TaxID=652676 RepID=A0A1W1CA30_9ZZZZ